MLLISIITVLQRLLLFFKTFLVCFSIVLVWTRKAPKLPWYRNQTSQLTGFFLYDGNFGVKQVKWAWNLPILAKKVNLLNIAIYDISPSINRNSQRVPKTPIFWRPSCIVYPHFSNFFHSPPYFFCCLDSLAKCVWSGHLSCIVLLNDIMNLHLWNLGTLVLVAPCCVLSNKASNLLKVGNAWRFLLVLWFDITHTNKHGACRGQYINTHV